VFRTCCPDWRHFGSSSNTSSSNSSSSNHLSRVASPGAVKVFVVNGGRDAEDGVPAGVYTKNVVYREVFNSVFTHFAAIDGLAGM
jgi:hypothetical protein